MEKIIIDKDIYVTNTYLKIIQRMGWKISDCGQSWEIEVPKQDVDLFDFIFETY